MKKKIKNEKISKIALEILNKTNESLSIAQITEKLEKEYDIKISPQVVKRHLEELAKKGEIEQV
jgi:predicted ArsR family transcriptional regulator